MTLVGRLLVGVGLGLAVAGSAHAQAPGPAGPRPAARPAPARPSMLPPLFPCRTPEEVCHLGFVAGSQVVILFSNARNARGIDERAIDVTGPDDAKLDLSAHAGRVVMLTGVYDPRLGLTKAELVEVASPLISLLVKAQLGGEDAPPPGGPVAPPRAAAPPPGFGPPPAGAFGPGGPPFRR